MERIEEIQADSQAALHRTILSLKLPNGSSYGDILHTSSKNGFPYQYGRLLVLFENFMRINLRPLGHR